METTLIAAEIFIPLVILAVTQLIKKLLPAVHDWLTIVVAILVGVVIALIDQEIGVPDITIAMGVFLALGAIGLSVGANKIAGRE